ncbi:hypothetical protein JTB14_038033 [Gonioctena quinquepunctata]|nr:hypothetical protein JTB14_038033 [Gonioctena quinquepunctata]
MEENDDSFSGSETEKIKKNNPSVNPDLEDTRRDETNTNPPVEITGIENIAAHSKVSPDEKFILVEINAIHQKKIALESKHFDGLLPLGTRNMKNKKDDRTSYNDCTYREGTFDSTKQEFRSIYDNKKVIRGRYAFVFNKKRKSVNNTCVLYFKYSRYLKKKHSLKLYAYCAHICEIFILSIHISDIDHSYAVYVFSTSRDFNHVGKLSHQLRGIERKMVKN